jgi:hypothetical protein
MSNFVSIASSESALSMNRGRFAAAMVPLIDVTSLRTLINCHCVLSILKRRTEVTKNLSQVVFLILQSLSCQPRPRISVILPGILNSPSLPSWRRRARCFFGRGMGSIRYWFPSFLGKKRKATDHQKGPGPDILSVIEGSTDKSLTLLAKVDFENPREPLSE